MRTLFKGAVVLSAIGLLMFAVDVPAVNPHTSFSTQPARPNGGTRDPIAETAGTLRRSDSGLSMTVFTFVQPNAAHTVWWVAFNKPENCNNPLFDSSGQISRCSAPDISNPNVEASVLWATGALVDVTGLFRVSGQLGIGPSGIPGQNQNGGGGLTNVKGAEVHLAIRNHGVVESMLDFTQFQVNGNPANPGQAATQQVVIFQP
jgi:hypothetical protein